MISPCVLRKLVTCGVSLPIKLHAFIKDARAKTILTMIWGIFCSTLARWKEAFSGNSMCWLKVRWNNDVFRNLMCFYAFIYLLPCVLIHEYIVIHLYP